MTDLRACVIGTLTTHGFLPHSRTQEGPGGVMAPTTEPARLTDNSGRATTPPSLDDPTEGAGIAGNPLTDTSGSREIAQHIEAQKRKGAE